MEIFFSLFSRVFARELERRSETTRLLWVRSLALAARKVARQEEAAAGQDYAIGLVLYYAAGRDAVATAFPELFLRRPDGSLVCGWGIASSGCIITPGGELEYPDPPTPPAVQVCPTCAAEARFPASPGCECSQVPLPCECCGVRVMSKGEKPLLCSRCGACHPGRFRCCQFTD